MSGDEAIEQTSSDRKKRKEEGRLRKKKLIEEAGGKRPRGQPEESAPPVDDSNNDSPPQNHHRNNNNGNSSMPKRRGDSSSRNSRGKSKSQFGRVMDSVPSMNRPRYSTWSIAVPGSIVANCQTRELRTQLVGQIARAATIYHVDEIVVFDDKLTKESSSGRSFRRQRRDNHHHQNDGKDAEKPVTETPPVSTGGEQQEEPRSKYDPHEFMARVLQYCETPQYLRRHFFPMHPDLQFAGLLAPVDAPHHVRADDCCQYREGVTWEKQGRNGGTLVNCGIRGRPVEIQTRLQAGIRCTVKIDPKKYKAPGQLTGDVVSPSAPREDDGTYWGYTTRTASSLKGVLEDCPFEGGYDLKVGTSERGDADIDHGTFSVPTFKHAIIVFGGVAGIEESVDADEALRLPGSQSRKLFDMWINVCRYQGSRTIRTEEAVLITLAKLSPRFLLDNAQHKNSKMSGSKKDTEKEVEQPKVVFDDEAMSDESSEDDE